MDVLHIAHRHIIKNANIVIMQKESKKSEKWREFPMINLLTV